MRRISVVKNVMSANELLAQRARDTLQAHNVFAINVMASPGAGKTSLITRTVQGLKDTLRVGYVDGDVATSIDADKIAALGIPTHQINTGGSCHLDANMMLPALEKLPLAEIDLLIIENVGNLICPAEFDLGAHLNVLVASVPEGDDKPYKYPVMYRGVDVLVLNKVDLLPYIPFDAGYFRRGVEALNPDLTTFMTSCTTGEGIEGWVSWLADRVSGQGSGQDI